MHSPWTLDVQLNSEERTADHGQRTADSEQRTATSTYPSFVVESLGLNLSGSKIYKVPVSALDHDVSLTFSTKHRLGWLASTDDALVLHVGEPESRSKRTTRRGCVTLHWLGARVGGINGGGWLDGKEVDALERSQQALTRWEARRRIGEQLRRERENSARFKAWTVEFILGVEGLRGLSLHSLFGFGHGA